LRIPHAAFRIRKRPRRNQTATTPPYTRPIVARMPVGLPMPLFPRNSIWNMVINAAVMSMALSIIVQGMTLLIIYFLQEARLI
jgi:hypothetical protein